MPFKSLNFVPGINNELTSFANSGGWRDGNRVRFRDGFPESIGGWEKLSSTTFEGFGRNMFRWVTLSGNTYIALGTTSKFYVIENGTFYDITPIRETTAAGDVTFTATSGLSEIVVADTAHGASVGDFVTFSGAVSLGGAITAAVLNQEHEITQVDSANQYRIDPGVTAGGPDTGNGGASVVGEYQITIGGDDASSGGSIFNVRTWSIDNFGEDLIFNPRGGAIYYWDSSAGTSTRAVNLTTLASGTSIPTVANFIMVSDRDRHVIAFGCDEEANSGTQNPLAVRWSDQEDITEWRTLPETTAGEFLLARGNEIISAIATKRETIIFTDFSMHSLQWVGPPYTFGISEVAREIKMLGPNAAVAVNDEIYFMTDGRFMVYDGINSEIKCTVKDHVFSNITEAQKTKSFACHNSKFSEIWFFYPTSNSAFSPDECDRYAIYDYTQDIWSYGTLDRTAWLDVGVGTYPLATGPDNLVYQHEKGFNDVQASSTESLLAYCESSQVTIGEGDRYAFITRILPDVTFRNSTAGTPTVKFVVRVRDYPGEEYTASTESTLTQTDAGGVKQGGDTSTEYSVEEWTKQIYVRLRGRSMAIRIYHDVDDVAWRLGVPRLKIRTDGQR